MVVAEGRKLAQSLSGARKANMQQLCDEVEQLTYQLGDMCRRGQVSHWRHLQTTHLLTTSFHYGHSSVK